MRAQLCLPFVKTLFVSRRHSAATKRPEYLSEAKCRSSTAIDLYQIVRPLDLSQRFHHLFDAGGDTLLQCAYLFESSRASP